MKTKSISLILFLFIILKISFGDNVLIVNNSQATENQTATISINMENDSAIVAFQFDIPLSDQLTYVSNSALLNSSRIVDHVLDAKVLDGDTLRIFGYSLNNNAFTDNTGTIVSFQLLTGTVPGNYTLDLCDPLLGNTLSTNVLTNSINGTLTILGPNINLPVSSLDFGEVPLLDSTNRILTINNIGNQELNIQDIVFDTLYFSVVGNSNFTIPPNQSQNITVKFNSVIKGDYNNFMTIISDDYDESLVNVDLSVIAFAVNELHTGNMFAFAGDYATLDFTINNMEPFIGFQFDMIMPSPMSFVPDSVFLSSRKNNHSISASTLSENTLRVVAYSENNQWFSGVNGDILSLGFNIDGIGGYYNLQISNVVIGDTNAENAVSDYYYGQLQIAASDISCSNSIDFGNVSILGSKQENLTIYNNGSDTLEISSFTFNNSSFSTTASFPIVILPGQNTNVSVNFTKSTEGSTQGVMRIWSNDPDEDPYSVNLSGFAFVPNYLLVKDTAFNQGDTVCLELQVSNIESFTGFQFDLDFSDSLSCVLDSIFLSNRAQDHVIQSSFVDANTLRVFSYSMTQQDFTGNSGSIISIPFIADTNIFGSLSFHLSNAVLGDSLSEDILWGTNDGDIIIYKSQEIGLSAGWNIISFNVEPWYMNMDSALSPQMYSSNLIKMIDETGGFIQYIPDVGWLNTIGNIEATEGYYIKVQNNDTINLTGNKLGNPYTIPLQQGWNIMGYPQYKPDSALSIFQPLISAGTLVKVIDESGGFIQYIPGAGWLDYITLLEPGEGYYIKVSQNTNLTLTEPSQKSITINNNTGFPPTKHFVSNIDSPFNPMHFVLIIKNQNGIISPGDEIAIYDRNKCVGSALITENNLNPIVVITNNDDPTTEEIDGFIEGNPFKIKFWHKDDCVEYQYINTVTISGDKNFVPLSTYIGEIDMKKVGSSSLIDTDLQAFIGNNYPNPFNNKTYISYWVSDKASVKISLFNLNENEIKEIFNQYQEQGIYNIKIGETTLKPGIYLCKITINGGDFKLEKTLKMIKR